MEKPIQSVALEYTGVEGQFDYADGRSLRVSAFVLAETEEGAQLDVEIQTVIPILNDILGPGEPPTQFVARTAEGTTLTLKGYFALHAVPTRQPYVARYQCIGRLAVAAPASTTAVNVKVRLANFIFYGNVSHSYELGADGQPATGDAVVKRVYQNDGIRFTAGGQVVEIVQQLDYRQVTAELAAASRPLSTAWLTINAASPEAVETTTLPIVQTICALLTLATGTHVDWLAAYSYQGDSLVRALRRAAPIRPFVNGPPLIGRHEPPEICRFIETTYAAFVESGRALQLDAVVHAYADGLSAGLLETKTLTMAVLGEFLTTSALNAYGIDHTLLPKPVAKQLRRVLTWVASCVLRLRGRYARTRRQEIETAIESVRGNLNWVTDPSLAHKIDRVNNHLSAGLTPSDISAFVRTRNELTHRMRFKRSLGTPYEQYQAVRYVVDRFLLGILRYEGPFIDCRSLARPTSNRVRASQVRSFD